MKKKVAELLVAYSAGPPEIVFAGRAWVRGQPQPVSAEQWAAMRARSDCAGFAFAEVSIHRKD